MSKTEKWQHANILMREEIDHKCKSLFIRYITCYTVSALYLKGQIDSD